MLKKIILSLFFIISITYTSNIKDDCYHPVLCNLDKVCNYPIENYTSCPQDCNCYTLPDIYNCIDTYYICNCSSNPDLCGSCKCTSQIDPNCPTCECVINLGCEKNHKPYLNDNFCAPNNDLQSCICIENNWCSLVHQPVFNPCTSSNDCYKGTFCSN